MKLQLPVALLLLLLHLLLLLLHLLHLKQQLLLLLLPLHFLSLLFGAELHLLIPILIAKLYQWLLLRACQACGKNET